MVTEEIHCSESYDRMGVSLLLHLVITAIIVVPSGKDWYKTDFHGEYHNVFLLSGLMMLGAIYACVVIYIGLHINDIDKQFRYYMYFLISLIITTPLVHVIGRIVIYWSLSKDDLDTLPIIRMICYMVGITVVGFFWFVGGCVITSGIIIKGNIKNYIDQRQHHIPQHEYLV